MHSVASSERVKEAKQAQTHMHAQKTSIHLDIINRCHGDGLRLSQARSRQFISVRALILCMHAVFVHTHVCVLQTEKNVKIHRKDSQPLKGDKG